MRALRTFLSRARALGRGRRLERDLKQEIAAHLEEAAEEYVRQGLSPADARRSFGGVAQVEEQYRDVCSFVWVGHVSRDIQYAVRTLRRTPGFTAATIVTLALAIGANTVAFSVVNALVSVRCHCQVPNSSRPSSRRPGRMSPSRITATCAIGMTYSVASRRPG
jgi:hypothetical protein